MSLKYSFNVKELNNWKARITERIVGFYIRETLTPKLKKEGFELIFWNNPPLPLGAITVALLEGSKDIDWEKAYDELVIHDESVTPSGERKNVKDLPKEERRVWIENWKNTKEEGAKKIPNEIKLFFLERGFYPNSNLFNSTIKLLSLLEVATDGILFKLKIDGKTIEREKALLGLEDRFKYTYMPEKIPVVSGEIEVIEIKSDRAFIMPHQAENYRKVIESGFKLHYFHVFIISFEKNQFEIIEKLVKNAAELDELIKAERRQNHLRRGISEFKK